MADLIWFTKWLVGGALAIVPATALFLNWAHDRESAVDLAWSREQIREAQVILEMLEKYRSSRGSYPTSLGDLPEAHRIPRVRSRSSSGQVSFAWHYESTGNDYELHCRPLNGLNSSWDMLLYRPGKDYPTRWSDIAEIHSIDGWIYVVGGQLIYERESRVPPDEWPDK